MGKEAKFLIYRYVEIIACMNIKIVFVIVIIYIASGDIQKSEDMLRGSITAVFYL